MPLTLLARTPTTISQQNNYRYYMHQRLSWIYDVAGLTPFRHFDSKHIANPLIVKVIKSILELPESPRIQVLQRLQEREKQK
jgi:hypothetical protein